MNVSSISSQAQYQSVQQASASARKAAVQQVATTLQQRPDGDGDHGVETQGTAIGGTTTGQLVNVLA